MNNTNTGITVLNHHRHYELIIFRKMKENGYTSERCTTQDIIDWLKDNGEKSVLETVRKIIKSRKFELDHILPRKREVIRCHSFIIDEFVKIESMIQNQAE
jgi:hypothetical protein